MINWQKIEQATDIKKIAMLSKQQPCLIYKHSSRCNLSNMALYSLEEDWKFSEKDVQPFFLDVIQYQKLAFQVAEEFSVHHESPQVLLIQNGECTYETSHLDINVEEIAEGLEEDMRFY